MTASADPALAYAVDTSVAIPALDAGHAAHLSCLAVVRQHRPAVAGHAASEVYAVLTRMPGQLAVAAPVAAALIDRVFPTVAFLGEVESNALRGRLGVLGITGGMVYDALVAEAARVNQRVLLTRDRRAVRTYDLIGADYLVVGP